MCNAHAICLNNSIDHTVVYAYAIKAHCMTGPCLPEVIVLSFFDIFCAIFSAATWLLLLCWRTAAMSRSARHYHTINISGDAHHTLHAVHAETNNIINCMLAMQECAAKHTACLPCTQIYCMLAMQKHATSYRHKASKEAYL